MIEATEISRVFAFTFHLPLATYHCLLRLEYVSRS